MNLDEFEQLALTRRSIRNFRPDPVPPPVLDRLLNVARWAPSGFNLQPTHITIVTEPHQKRRLHAACLSQRQILDAPIVAVFTGDRRAYRHNFAAMLEAERAAGTINPAYESELRRIVGLAFERGPVGLGWLWKAVLPPILRFWMPIPSIPAVQMRFWLAKQVMLSAMNFVLGAHAAGLASVPMEGFDERRVRRAVGLPRWHAVVVVVALGYSVDDNMRKTRLPAVGRVHRERFRD